MKAKAIKLRPEPFPESSKGRTRLGSDNSSWRSLRSLRFNHLPRRYDAEVDDRPRSRHSHDDKNEPWFC
jgi:hypothetical protein